jgi:hypothetical protein
MVMVVPVSVSANIQINQWENGLLELCNFSAYDLWRQSCQYIHICIYTYVHAHTHTHTHTYIGWIQNLVKLTRGCGISHKNTKYTTQKCVSHSIQLLHQILFIQLTIRL